ncbi:hypothetical protein LTR86_008230 [Recurvomyces mirabilis]|nr:hypothetical protein LTR86_008230 [Recurvomyces mirabilis]
MAHTQGQDTDRVKLSSDVARHAAGNSALQSQDQPHLALITGMFNLYATLLSMGYLNEDEIAWPPQTSRLNARDWLNHGLSQVVVDVLNFLPVIDSSNLTSDQLVILPGASPPDFFAEAGSSYATDPRCSGDLESCTPPTWLPLAFRIGYGGVGWYYNVTGHSIGMWSQANDLGTGPLSTVPIVWEPAQQVLDGWVGHLRNLTWIPDRSADQGPIIVLADIQAMPSGSRDAATHPFYQQQTRLNAFYARRRIYREYGWPTKQYRKDDCQAALANFNAQLDTLERRVSAALHPSMEPCLYYPEVQAEPAGQYTAFLEDAAGDEADRVAHKVAT